MDRLLGPTAAHNDEPTTDDRLGRTAYAEALARLAAHCDTPFVIGLYGGAGTGKTSLMRLIDGRLDKGSTRTVWFDARLHQAGDVPALALLRAATEATAGGGGARRLLGAIGEALGAAPSSPTTAATLPEAERLRRRLDEERRHLQDARARVRERVEALVRQALARGSGAGQRRFARLLGRRSLADGGQRLVVFIDHLDRCAPATAQALLESLTLHLNVPGCVYFLALDRQGIERRLTDAGVDATSHLERAVQLPFSIPPVPRESMAELIEALLPPRFRHCKRLLVEGLGDTPRQVKRFLNHLTLVDGIAPDLGIERHDPLVLTLLLLIRSRSLPLYRLIENHPEVLIDLVQERDDGLQERAPSDELLHDRRLVAALAAARKHFPGDPSVVARHLRLVALTRADGREPTSAAVEAGEQTSRWPEYLAPPAGATTTAASASPRGRTRAAIREALDLMVERFDAEAVPAGRSLVLGLHLSGRGGGSWYFDLDQGRCQVVTGMHGAPTASLSLSADDFVEVATGRLSPREAIAAGKIKVRGDGGLAVSFATIFGMPYVLRSAAPPAPSPSVGGTPPAAT